VSCCSLGGFRNVGAVVVLLLSAPVTAQIIVVGGEDGLSWETGAGDVDAVAIRSSSRVEVTNAPGGVIDFDPEGLPNGIFPQRADTTVNIALGLNSKLRGGQITSPNTISIRGALGLIIDDDAKTALDLRATSGTASARVLGILIDIDLGARFGINRFRFFPRNALDSYPAPQFPFQNEFMRAYEIFVNDGTPEAQFEGTPILQTVAIETQNEEQVVDVRIEPQYVRFVRLKSLTPAGFEIAEFQIFGTGFVPEAGYLSNIFDFGDLALLGNLRWIQLAEGDPGRSRLNLRTRSGRDPDPVEYNKQRPGEFIFRVGGAEAGTAGTQFRRPDVPWRDADDVEDAALSNLVETVLDNEDVDVRFARERFRSLPLDDKEKVTLTKSDWEGLRNEDRGQARDDTDDWSSWSPPYSLAGVVEAADIADPTAGVALVSPSPRRYFQFSIDFFSDDFDAAIGVGALAFDVLSPPFAESLIGEIAPRQAEVGQQTKFVIAVRSILRQGTDRGFTGLDIDTPLRVQRVGRVRIVRPSGTQEADFSSTNLEILPSVIGNIRIAEVRDDLLSLEFPLIDENDAVITVEIETAVLRFGTTFTVRARNAEASQTLTQQTTPGNAEDLSLFGVEDTDISPIGTPDGQSLSVAVTIARNLLTNVSAQPAIFSPNSDGVNDVSEIQYDITNIGRPIPLRIVIYDLSGRIVRVLRDDLDNSGRFRQAWDGLANDGELVPPGNYIFRITLEAGTGDNSQVGVVSVVY
jgi:hypothetical protein